MELLQRKISFDQIVFWRAFNADELELLRPFFGDNALTLSEILNTTALHPDFRCRIVLIEQILTGKVLHQFALDFANEYVKSIRKKDDPIVNKILEAKKKWIHDEISTGALVVHRKGIPKFTAGSSEETENKLISVLTFTLETDPSRCIERVYYDTCDFEGIAEEIKTKQYGAAWKNRLRHVVNKLNKLSEDTGFMEEVGFKIPQVAERRILSSMNNASVVPVGSILAYGGAIPANFEDNGWMVCNGRSLSRESFNLLFDKIGNAFGRPDEKSFNIPDLRGVFLRGVSGASKRDPDADSRTPLNRGGNDKNNVGSVQGYATAQPDNSFTATIKNGHSDGRWFDGGPSDAIGLDPSLQPFDIDSGGDKESRPINKYVYYIIKYAEVTREQQDVDIPIGSIIPFAGTHACVIDLSWKLCDGTLLSNKGVFASLFSAIRFAHGGMSESEFKLPDYRGYFLRGVAQKNDQRDPNFDQRTYPFPSGANGYKGNDKGNVGSAQMSATGLPVKENFKTFIDVPLNAGKRLFPSQNFYVFPTSASTVDVTQGGGDAESRPLNISVNWYIRFR